MTLFSYTFDVYYWWHDSLGIGLLETAEHPCTSGPNCPDKPVLSTFFHLVATVDTLFLATISEETISISNFETIIFNVAPINRGGNYNTGTGGYTAPYNGYYQ